MTIPRREPLERQAVRILFIIRYCGEQVGKQLDLFEPFSYHIESEKKLQKIEFWVRNPDYLAEALLDACAPHSKFAYRRIEVKSIIHNIFLEREPKIRAVPMQRYFHGAYEPLDRVMAYLISRHLVSGYKHEYSHRSTSYYLTSKGKELVDEMLEKCPETHWYAERCQLINSFWGHLSGHRIGAIQHGNPIYHNTKIADIIRSIEKEVREKFHILFGENLPDEP